MSPTILGHGYLATLDVGLAAFTLLFFFTLWRYLQNAPSWERLVLCGVAMGLMLGTKFSALFLLPVAAVLLVKARRLGAFVLMLVIATVVVQALYLSPGGLFLYSLGMQRVNADHNPDYLVFLAGQFQHSFVTYFPVAYLLKEPIAAILLAGLGLFAMRRELAWYLVLPPLVSFAAHMAFADDLGVRYIIPALPFLYLIGGLGAAWLIGKGMPGRIAAGVLGAWLLFTSFAIAPDHLSYFNEAAGGPRGGPSWLDDSNVDWGQGLKQLRVWANQNAKGRPIKLFYFGSFPPAAYGWNAEPLDDLMKPPTPGLYAVSGHFVARVPAEWLKRPPAAIVGHALYVFDIPAK